MNFFCQQILFVNKFYLSTIFTIKFLNFRTPEKPKIDTTGQNLRVLHQKDANGKANSEDPDQTAPDHNGIGQQILFVIKEKSYAVELYSVDKSPTNGETSPSKVNRHCLV